MALEIGEREKEGIKIADLRGRIVMGPEATTFRETIGGLASAEHGRLILNMAHVDYIDSTGLGALVYISSTASKSSGVVKLLAMNDRNLELLVTTKLETIFETFKNEQDAIDSFFPDRKIEPFDILQFVREQQKSK